MYHVRILSYHTAGLPSRSEIPKVVACYQDTFKNLRRTRPRVRSIDVIGRASRDISQADHLQWIEGTRDHSLWVQAVSA